jgi:hypothetical protein
MIGDGDGEGEGEGEGSSAYAAAQMIRIGKARITADRCSTELDQTRGDISVVRQTPSLTSAGVASALSLSSFLARLLAQCSPEPLWQMGNRSLFPRGLLDISPCGAPLQLAGSSLCVCHERSTSIERADHPAGVFFALLYGRRHDDTLPRKAERRAQ